MKIIMAEAMGMCFGVRDALAVARTLDKPTRITIRGELVHNPVVNRELESRGFTLVGESQDQTPGTPVVLITAHGTSHRQRARLLAAGKTVIDTTCPLVRKAHRAALELERSGFHVLVIGQRDHVEVRGLTGDLDSFDILERPGDVRRYGHWKLGLIAQTTCPEREARSIVERVCRLNGHALVRFVNTICQPTRDRQEALERLLDHVDMLVVVGGRNSNNTGRLVQRAWQRGVPAIHVEEAADLCPDFFAREMIVGLTAGTSTLPETIAAVGERLAGMFAEDGSAEAQHTEAMSQVT